MKRNPPWFFVAQELAAVFGFEKAKLIKKTRVGSLAGLIFVKLKTGANRRQVRFCNYGEKMTVMTPFHASETDFDLFIILV